MPKIAIVAAKGLGDALISMVLSHNLLRSKFDVTTFSTVLTELKGWFPDQNIQPFPKPENFKETFGCFDRVIAADHAILKEHHGIGTDLLILKEDHFDKKKTLVENLRLACLHKLKLPFCEAHNGIQVPPGLHFRKFEKRVIVHPTSAELKRTWPAEKFIRLCEKLQTRGFKPVVCISPAESKVWKPLLEGRTDILMPFFQTVDQLASFVYESGFMIGNNSGIGHLASSLKIPTLSLFSRKSYANLWRPGFGPGDIVTPLPLAIGARMKEKTWKKFLTVPRVLNAFAALQQKNS